MAGISFNEFQRELKRLGIEGPVAIILTTMYEQMRENATQLDICANVLNSLADTVGNVVQLNDVMHGRLDELKGMMVGDAKGVDVRSTHLRDK